MDRNHSENRDIDEMLARRVFAGDNQAGLKLWKSLEDGVWQFIYRRLGRDYQNAQDILQETCYCFFERLRAEPFAAREGGVRGFLFRIASNKINDMGRRQRATDPSRVLTNKKLKGEKDAPLQSAIESEDGQRLTAAMSELAENQRQVVVKYYYDCKTLKEIGSDMGTSESTAHRRLKDAETKLRRMLREGDTLNEVNVSI